MYLSFSESNRSIGEVLAALRTKHQPDHASLALAIGMSYTTYLKVERDQRELSFLMALRLCQFYQVDIHEFISMLGDSELQRTDRSVIAGREKRDRKKAEKLSATVIDITTTRVFVEAKP